MISRIGAMRHLATFFRPSEGLSDRGQVDGSPTMIADCIPVLKRAIGGREIEVARQLLPAADFVLELHGPCSVKPNDIAVVSGDRLLVGYVEDVDQDGRHYKLICAKEQEVSNG